MISVDLVLGKEQDLTQLRRLRQKSTRSLTSDINGISIQRIRIRIQDCGGAAERRAGAVSVRVIGRAGRIRGGGVGEFVDRGGRLVLGVAGAAECWQS